MSGTPKDNEQIISEAILKLCGEIEDMTCLDTGTKGTIILGESRVELRLDRTRDYLGRSRGTPALYIELRGYHGGYGSGFRKRRFPVRADGTVNLKLAKEVILEAREYVANSEALAAKVKEDRLHGAEKRVALMDELRPVLGDGHFEGTDRLGRTDTSTYFEVGMTGINGSIEVKPGGITMRMVGIDPDQVRLVLDALGHYLTAEELAEGES